MFKQTHMNMEDDLSSVPLWDISALFFQGIRFFTYPEDWIDLICRRFLDFSNLSLLDLQGFPSIWPQDVHHLTIRFTTAENWMCMYIYICIYTHTPLLLTINCAENPSNSREFTYRYHQIMFTILYNIYVRMYALNIHITILYYLHLL